MKHTRGRDGSRSVADWNRLANLYRNLIARLVSAGPITVASMHGEIRGQAGPSFNREFNVEDLKSVLWKLGYVIGENGLVSVKPKEPTR